MVETRELADPLYARNEADRCYHCKTALFRRLAPLAAAEGFAHVVYGLIVDDLADYRPGQRAAEEAGVRAPLAEAGLHQAGRARALAASSSCRRRSCRPRPASPPALPYGTPGHEGGARARRPRRVGAAGARASASCACGTWARRRASRSRPRSCARLADAALREAVERAVVSAGYSAVEIDPQGYRRGRLNEALRVVQVSR